MSLWDFDGEDTSLTAWSSLSQFDDMVWNEFGETNGDHVVPNPSSPQSFWLPNGDRRKRIYCEDSLSGSTIKGESATSAGMLGSVSELSSEASEVGKLSEERPVPGSTTTALSVFSKGGGGPGLERVLELTAESEPFGSDHPPAVQDTEDIGDKVGKDHKYITTGKSDVQVYTCERDASMVGDPFSRDEGIEMFGSENVVSKADTLLELDWENINNLDDMDKLFRNNHASFDPVLVNGTEGLDWPSSSSAPLGALDRGVEFEKPSRVSESIAAKPDVDEFEDKEEVVFDDCLPELVMDSVDDVISNNGSPRSLSFPAGALVQQYALSCEDKRGISCEAKVYRVRRNAANRKRNEDRFRQTTAHRKLSPGAPYNFLLGAGRQLQTCPLRLPCQPSLLQPASAFPLQYFSPSPTPGLIGAPHQLQMSQGVPYIQVAYPVHHVPVVSYSPSIPMMQMQHSQSMFVDISQAISQGQKQPRPLSQASPMASSWPLDAANCPPTRSLNMTPQEKMEKLRWRQQMQARLAIEQQQQQLLASQNGNVADPMYQKQQLLVCHNILPNQSRRTLKFTPDLLPNSLLEEDQGHVVREGDDPSTSCEGDVDYSLEGSVLYQLKSTVSALDMGTRLCIRDALYRLARSAMKRRAAGIDNLNGSQGSKDQVNDANPVKSSTASRPQSSGHSKATRINVVETETNRIDRSIAKLLFSKPQPLMFSRPHAHV